jgi:hypothetical protein
MVSRSWMRRGFVAAWSRRRRWSAVKSHANLWPRVTAFENLYAAVRRARAGKRGRPDVAAFEHDLERNLFDLQRELRDESYCPGGYRHFVIREPTRRKISGPRKHS